MILREVKPDILEILDLAAAILKNDLWMNRESHFFW